MRKPGLGAITTSTTGSSTSCSTAPRARSERLCGSTKFFSWTADGAGTDPRGLGPFLLLGFLHRRAREPLPLDARPPPAVPLHLEQDFAAFLASASVRPC